jgi:hypothetical protein
MKRSVFLELLKKNDQNKIKQFIEEAEKNNEDLNHYEDVTEFTHTPLLDGTTEGNETAVASLLATKKVLADGNGWGYSPLMIASAKGFISIIKQLLPYQPNLSYEVEWSQTSPQEIQIIRTNNTHIENERYNTLKEYRYCATDTAETLAVRHGQLDVLNLLMQAKGEQLNKDNNHLLCIAAQENQLATLKYLQSLGFDLNKPNAKKETPLRLAARYSNFETVEYLVTQELSQADIHKALQEAISSRTSDMVDHLETIEILISADKNIKAPIVEEEDKDSPFAISRMRDEEEEPTKKTLMDYAVERVEMPDRMGGFNMNFLQGPDIHKLSVICLLLEAGVPRTQEPMKMFSDGALYKGIVEAHQALVSKGLHAREIAREIFNKFIDPNFKVEKPVEDPAESAAIEDELFKNMMADFGEDVDSMSAEDYQAAKKDFLAEMRHMSGDDEPSEQAQEATSSEPKAMTPKQRMDALLKSSIPAEIKAKDFMLVVPPMVALFETKSTFAKMRQEKASKPSQTPQTMFMRTLKEKDLLWSKPENNLVVVTAQKAEENSASSLKM